MTADLGAQVRSSAAALTSDETGGPVLVGVSGGADSLALLHLLWRWSHEGGPPLQAVHVDHGLRPESSAEADGVRALCTSWRVPVTVARADVRALQRERRSGIEDAARVARYRAFATVAERCGARVLALGHQADDQAETVLLHLLRGAGLAGLGAMAPLQRSGDLFDTLFGPDNGVPGRPAIWRPLLAVRRAAIDAYCREWGLVPILDTSNDDLTLRRNAVRRLILPLIERHFPGVGGVLARDATLLAADNELLELAIDARWDQVARVEGGLVIFDRSAFRREPRASQRRLLRRAWVALRGSTEGFAAEPVELACAAIAGGKTGARQSLPKGLVVVLDRERAALGDAVPIDERLRHRLGVPLIEPGRVEAVVAGRMGVVEGGWAIAIEEGAVGRDGRWQRHIPDTASGLAWVLRGWRPGDRRALRGGRGTQKLHDWAVDRRVPRYARRQLVLLACGERVAWVAGLADFPLPAPSESPVSERRAASTGQRPRGGEVGLRLRVLYRGEPVGVRDEAED